MSENIVLFLFLSIISILGTVIGSLFAIIIKRPSRIFLAAMMAFAGGLMLAIVVFDLIPECLNRWNFKSGFISIIMGTTFIYIVDNFIKKQKSSKSRSMQIAIITAIGLMIHNFPEGVIMGCSFVAGGSLGIKICILIAIHDIPEGLAVAMPMVLGKIDSLKIFFFTAITAIPTAVGAAIGVFIGNLSEKTLGTSLGVASGIMLYVVCFSMIPEAIELSKANNKVKGAMLIGILSGFFMCVAL